MIIPLFDIATEDEQLKKVTEEYIEVLKEYIHNGQDRYKREESMDLIQATLNLIYIAYGIEGVEEALAKHEVKMKNRGYEVEHSLDIKVR